MDVIWLLVMRVFMMLLSTLILRQVDKIMTKDLITFQYDDYIDDVKTVINKTRFRSYPILDKRNNVIELYQDIMSFDIQMKFDIVDHNEYSQSIEGAEEETFLK